MQTLIVIACFFVSLVLHAQMPGSDVYVGDLRVQNGLLQVSHLEGLTNRPNYDNQPFFLDDGQHLLVTSAIDDSGHEQTDSFVYDLVSGSSQNLTYSSVSEYSPTQMPNKIDISVIRADKDEQKLWRHPLPDTDGEPAAVVAASELLAMGNPIGYHAWIDANKVLLFVVGEPHSLQLADIGSKQSTILDRNIGPSLWPIPQSDLFSYTVSKGEIEGEERQWTLKAYDPQSGEIHTLTQLPQGAYYYGWSGDGKAIAAQGSVLKQWDSQIASPKWTVFADVNEICPLGVTRLTTNQQNNKIALVCNR